jgi:hypothetical protein
MINFKKYDKDNLSDLVNEAMRKEASKDESLSDVEIALLDQKVRKDSKGYNKLSKKQKEFLDELSINNR